MAKYAFYESEWYPVMDLACYREPRLGDDCVELSDAELARVNAAFAEFWAVQRMMDERIVKMTRELPVIDEDPMDPYVRYELEMVAFDRGARRLRLH
jgi:hypothetical protein